MNLTRDEALALSMHFHRLEEAKIELSPMMEDLWKRVTEFLEKPKLGFGEDNDALQTLNALLDPDISTPVILREVTIDPEAVSRSLQTAFDEYALDLNDPWVGKIKGIEENQELWKLALAATYQVIKGSDRTSVETWNLIAKTYQLLAKNG